MNNHQNYDNSGWQAAGVLNVNGVYPLFGRKHDVFLTANLNREHSDSTWRRVWDDTPFDITDFTGSEIAEPDWGNDSILKNRTSYDADRTDLGLLLGTRYNLTDEWHIIAGARYAKFKSRGHTYWQIWNGKPDPDGTTTSEQTTTHLTPYGASHGISPNPRVCISATPKSSSLSRIVMLPETSSILWSAKTMNSG